MILSSFFDFFFFISFLLFIFSYSSIHFLFRELINSKNFVKDKRLDLWIEDEEEEEEKIHLKNI